MNPPLELSTMQIRINEIQRLYRDWTQLVPKLEAARQDWQHGMEIMQKLAQFYFSGEFRHYYEALENSPDIDLRTEGEYSVMSEDTLWNAFHEQRQFAWQRLRSAIAVLDKEGETGE